MTDDQDEELRRKLEAANPSDRIQLIVEHNQARAPTRESIEAHERRHAQAELRAERLESSGAREAITVDDFDRIVRGDQHLLPTAALHTVRAWHDQFHGRRAGRFKPYMVLYGMTGRGKTVAGCWLIAEEGGVYVTAPEARQVLTSGHWGDVARRDKVLRSRVLLLDDLGTEEDDHKAQEALFTFATKRQGLRNALSLLTANLALQWPQEPRKGLMTRYDERTIARLQHVGRFVEVVGEDLRSKL
jgi:DNA replication protein DnaC